MINRINEKIYNYIFSVNAELKNDKSLDTKPFLDKLDKIIAEKYDVIADFWDENVNDFNKDCVIKIQTLDSAKATYIYRNFPRMNSRTLISFLEHKASQIKNTIEVNGDFIKETLNYVFDAIENLGIKQILDYCEEIGIVKYIGKVFIAADDNPAYGIIYENIKPNFNMEMNITDKNILKTSFLIEYEQIEKIFDSANGEIWRVTDTDKNEYIAKILNKNISKEKLKRYRNEINFCRKNSNKHVIEIIDNGIKNINGTDYMFYIMPKYDCDFRTLMKDGIDTSNILMYFNQILEGIKYIHNRDGFHRDIKPENILYDKSKDMLVIADLGIAHFNEDDLIDDPKTKITSKMANFIYSAPEQRVKGGHVDYRCDIYALGLILNELFTGQVIQGSNYRKISDVNENYAFLDDIVEKMTNQNPDNRYNSIEEIQYAINASIEIHEKEIKEQELKKLSIEQNTENDVLISNPVKIIDVEITQGYKLIIKFNNILNDLWIDTLFNIDREEIYGYGPERYDFYRDTATLNLNQGNIDNAPKLVNYFKQWISSTNEIYPKKLEEQQKKEEIIRQEKIKKEIRDNEQLKEILKKIKI